MKTSAQVVVIGGGVIGASILYHLTKNGWHDVVLVERKELTAGSTWHSAGGMHTLNGDPNVAALQKYTIELYQEIQDISGQDCGLHLTGGLLLADTEERLDWLKLAHSRNRYLGLDTEIISVAEAKQILPYLDEQYFVGAMYDPMEGHVDPSGVTHAYAKAARMAGAEVYRNNWAMDIVQRQDGTWDVVCEQGTINAEHIVNCGGLWAREVGRMCGIELPILAMEHMYLLTEEVPGLLDWNRESGREGLHCMDFGGEIYMRQEGNGPAARHLRAQRCSVVGEADVMGFRRPTPGTRSRTDRRVARRRVRALPDLPRGRHQADHQRSVHVCARRQSGDRAGQGAAWPLARGRHHGRAQPGRRCRQDPRQLDHRR